ncbi:DUF952 domain-containing protein [Streptomyces sp. MMG1121]|uniref:DUF952 domain-containing protein n=1 Tax=Streptomyces sp. MMG1121 TaxID=1415544 RepID=UPI0006ADA0FB|nr:DUF952 domain-containing protein [Streptomyces sp. MMG1121]KOV57410.1 hypothetical protein ADK64_38650 [Streptomyces sp. MMG1121]
MLYHVVALDVWLADPDRPYAPPSLAKGGSVHCAVNEEAVLAAANRFHRQAAGPLVALLIDETRLDAPVEWVVAKPESPSPKKPGTPIPCVRGPINRRAVVGLMDVARDDEGRALALVPRG